MIIVKQAEKIRVAVLFGGRSAEHEVSLQSAMNVIQYLDPSRFEITPIGVDKQGKWFLGNDIFTKSLEQNKVHALHADDHAWFTPEWIGKPAEKLPLKNGLPKTAGQPPLFDVVFSVMHGTFCEDGTLQGLLELADLPYVGCGVLASAVGMDKDISKRLAIHADILVAPYVVIRHDQWQNHPEIGIQQIEKELAYPVFAKPANTGSSIGISKAKNREQLRDALNEAFRFDTKVLVEKGLEIHELEVAVLESLESSSDPIVSVVGEIKPRHEFYSYEAKYIDEQGAELLIPAPLPETVLEKVRAIARKLFRVLECEGMARVDLFLEKTTGKIYFNEINTIPGFTKISMYPKLMEASGMAYSALLTHLIQLAIKRHKNKSSLVRSYSG